jgi:hypothetical protein
MSDTWFSLKCIQKEKPFLLVSLMLGGVLLVFGIILRMFEILNMNQDEGKDYEFYINGIWNIAVAITTGRFFII